LERVITTIREDTASIATRVNQGRGVTREFLYPAVFVLGDGALWEACRMIVRHALEVIDMGDEEIGSFLGDQGGREAGGEEGEEGEEGGEGGRRRSGGRKVGCARVSVR
jgi:hypothetical protein